MATNCGSLVGSGMRDGDGGGGYLMMGWSRKRASERAARVNRVVRKAIMHFMLVCPFQPTIRVGQSVGLCGRRVHVERASVPGPAAAIKSGGLGVGCWIYPERKRCCLRC